MLEIVNSITEIVRLTLILKIVTLVALFVFLVFSFILTTQVKSLNRIVYIHANNASRITYTLTILYFLAVFSLFIIALVIL